jgi:hypothetical protein
MRYSPDNLRQALPDRDPPDGAVPGEVEEEIAFWSERSRVEGPAAEEDRALVARSTRWTYAMFEELGRRQARFSTGVPPWILGMSVEDMAARALIGLLDPDAGTGFGLTFLQQTSRQDFGVVGQVAFPRLNAQFPVCVRQVAEDDHAPPHPAGATSAAWARCNTTSRWGVVTAGHAAGGNRPGRTVHLANGAATTLIRSARPPLDAAFIGAHAPLGNPPLLAVRRFPAAGQGVSIELQSGPVARTVVEAMNALGVVNTRAFPILMFTDQACARGDSGALVRSSTGEAVGIYLGGLRNAVTPGGVAGRVLNFEQAALALDVTAYL